MSGVGYFSLVILVFTFVAIGIILAMSIIILKMDPEEVNDKYPDLELDAEARDYNKFDGMMVPVFAATMMCLFEGNQ
jgi:cell division protein FtsL